MHVPRIKRYKCSDAHANVEFNDFHVQFSRRIIPEFAPIFPLLEVQHDSRPCNIHKHKTESSLGFKSHHDCFLLFYIRFTVNRCPSRQPN